MGVDGMRGLTAGLLLALAAIIIAGCSGLPAAPDTVAATDPAFPGALPAAFVGPSSSTSDTTGDADKPAPIEHPTKADLAVAGPLGDRFLGKADAPLTVIEYASLTCPHCSAFQKQVFEQVKKAYIDTGKVRWVLREFPIGHTSGAAWIVNRCAPEAMYWKLYDTFMRNQGDWVSLEVRPDAIAAVAAKAGMTRQQFDACWNNPETDAGLRWVKARGRQLGVSGTPTFFIGETKVRAVPSFADFSAMLEAELATPGGSMQVAVARQLVKPAM